MADNLSDVPLASGGAAPAVNAEAPVPAAVAAAPAASPARPQPNFVGVVDKLAFGKLSGWAVTMNGTPCDVTIRLNGADVATVTSDQPRPDLVEKKLSRGEGGWQIDMSEMLKPGKSRIEAIFADGTPLRSSPFLYDSESADAIATAPANEPKTYVGAIDTPNDDLIGGWSIGSDFKAAAVVIKVNDGPSIVVQAEIDRPDLIVQQLTKSGGGWVVDIKPLLMPGLNLINITYPDGKHLPGSPIERQNGANPANFVRPTPLAEPIPAAAPAPVAAQPPRQLPPQNIQVAMSPFTKKPVAPEAVAEPAEVSSNVTPFPSRVAGKNGMPSLSELDELSLDDISLAIAAGMINVAPSAVHEPVPDPAPTEEEVEYIRHTQKRPGFFARLLGRG